MKITKLNETFTGSSSSGSGPSLVCNCNDKILAVANNAHIDFYLPTSIGGFDYGGSKNCGLMVSYLNFIDKDRSILVVGTNNPCSIQIIRVQVRDKT